MVLGETLIDADGHPHAMLGLLDLVTSFQSRKLHLGYRTVKASTGPFAGHWAAHEFHYASTLKAQGTALFRASDAWGRDLGEMGLVKGTVSGVIAVILANQFVGISLGIAPKSIKCAKDPETVPFTRPNSPRSRPQASVAMNSGVPCALSVLA